MAKPLTEAQKKAKAKADKERRAKKTVSADKKAKTARATKGTKPVKAAAPEPDDGKVRKIWGGKALRDFAKAVIVAQDHSSTAGGQVGQMITEKVKTKGLNGPMFRLALRVFKTAMRDPNKGRVDFDDLQFYFTELEIEKHCGDSLFEAREGAEDNDDGDGEFTPEEAQTDLPDGVSRLDDHRDNAAA